MIFRVIFVLFSIAFVLTDQHETEEGSAGFLLYLPGNLESGATISAYIEAHVTEPFTASLDFIHSSEERHFSSRQHITTGSGFIDIEVPEVDYWYGRVNLTVELESTKQQFHATHKNVYIYRDAQMATFIETDKPIYKPGQEVKFRLITINSQFKPETSNISKIVIESPNHIKLSQWRNVERPDGLVDLSFQLIDEPMLGIYQIRAYIDNSWVVQSFKVDEYVLPKFEVVINSPDYVLIDVEEYSIQVCAKYTYGQPVRGSVSGKVGQAQVGYYYYRVELIDGEEVSEPELHNAIEFSGELNNEGCLDVTVDVLGMELFSHENFYWRTKLGVTATVYEAGTGNEFSESVTDTKLEATPLNIILESPSVFKPGIPYQGRIKVNYPNEKPAGNEEIVITAELDVEITHEQQYTSDSKGIVNFEIPYAVKDKSVQFTVSSPTYVERNYSAGRYEVYGVRRYFSLKTGYSPTGRYAQILPVLDAVNAGDNLEVRVLYTSNDSAVSSDFKFQFVSRNRLQDAGASQVGESRRRRQATDENNETECQRQAREAEEKGGFGNFKPTCDENGLFTLSQCHGSTGHCWCVDTETGMEVPLTRRRPTEDRVNCEEPEGPIEVPIGELGPPDVLNFCPPGFQFADGIKACVSVNAEIETECESQAREAREKGLLGSFRPSCEEDGSFSKQQCHGSTGHCWCVETDTGLEISETRRSPIEEQVDCEADVEIIEVTISEETVCESQLREVSERGPLLGSFRPSCEEDGTYSKRQCHSSIGYCWCVETETGLEIPETRRGRGEELIDCDEIFATTTTDLPTEEPLILQITPEPIIHAKPQELHEAVFSVKITTQLSPEASLLVYYTSPEGEIVADSIIIKVNEAFENEVSLDFSDDEVLPGGDVTLKVSADPGSLCGVGIVDKSVYVLGGDNKLTPKKLFSAFGLSVRQVYNYHYCSYNYYRYKRGLIYDPHYNQVTYKDSTHAFSTAGLLTLTNLDLDVAPCSFRPIEFFRSDLGVSLASAPSTEPVKPREKTRSFFPETWLWSLSRVSDTAAELNLAVPHTITDWVANGFCTNVERGIGVASPVTLRAFQPFFLSMSLPYSLIRTEKTPIKVTVFNYLENCLVVQVTLADSDEYTISGESAYTVAVLAGESTTVTFKIASFALGDIPIQVSAESIKDDNVLCGNDAVSGPAGSRDAVVRNLLVKPEGEPESVTESAYLCLDDEEDTYNTHVSISIPPDHVPGTAKGEITVTGDLVGNTLSNVEELIRMPYGCGEQNLLSMVPNIVALQYLQAIGEASPEVIESAKKFIISGYQRELNYRRDDNSYSAFGNNNPSGSTFLTAFVIRTYAHAQKFVDIDEEDLELTIEWLRSIQEENGSFRTVGYLAHKAMKGGVNNNVTLAAYVVSTFLEAGYSLEDKTVIRGFEYIRSQLDSLEDTYATALLAYTYALAGMDEFDEVYQRLEDSAVDSGYTRHWESNRGDLPGYTNYYQDSSKAQNVEMTAYILRAILLRDIPNVALEGSQIARWLVSQRNPRGGFSSTQDTVIGLTALSEFARLGSGADTDLSIEMNYRGGGEFSTTVTRDNRFVIHRETFEDFPADISVSAQGRGCVLYAISGNYYIKKEKKTMDPFSLGIRAMKKTSRKRRHTGEHEEEEGELEADSCDRFTISVSARYNGEDGSSNMAIINFRPVSGFVFDKESLDSLKNKYSFVKRYEINADTVTFYFDEVTNEPFEFEFDVTKEFDVEDAKPALINILDYYENGLKVVEEFDFICGDRGPDDIVVPTTTYITPFSPTGFPSSTPTAEPDFDECSVANVCGGPEFECVNYPGTYECICADGYQLDEEEINCVAIPSCPVCDANGISAEQICSADLIQVMKVRVDGSVRPLHDISTDSAITERYYYNVVMDPACTCDLISTGSRFIAIGSTNQVSPSSGRWNQEILLDESVIVLPIISNAKKDVLEILDQC